MFRYSFYNNRWINIVIVVMMFIYALIMIKLLFWRGHDNDYHYNVIPFQTIKLYIVNRAYFDLETWIKNLFGNIVLFIPLGVLIPLLNRKFMKSMLFIVMILAVLLSVELLQMVTKVGSFDVDDILLNTIGAVMGLAITKRYIKRL